MYLWKCNNWIKYIGFSSTRRTGLKLRFQKDVDTEVRRSCIEFCKWLRKNYFFPIMVPIYFKTTEYIVSKTGVKYSAIFFEPFDKQNEPYIRIATGDFYEIKQNFCEDDALATILRSIAHELTHYYQWINDIKLTEEGYEKQARYYANKIIDKYAETRDHP